MTTLIGSLLIMLVLIRIALAVRGPRRREGK